MNMLQTLIRKMNKLAFPAAQYNNHENQAKEITEWQEFIVFHHSSCCWINNDI